MEARRRRIPRMAHEKTWELRHGTRRDQKVYPVRALLSWDVTERRMHILVAENGSAASLEKYAESALAMLRGAFPACEHEVVFWGEADESGLVLMAEKASRAVMPGERVPYEVCRLNLP